MTSNVTSFPLGASDCPHETMKNRKNDIVIIFFIYFSPKKDLSLNKNIHNGLIFIQSGYLGGVRMLETILGLTVLNTILILYMHRVIKNHHFYDGYPNDD